MAFRLRTTSCGLGSQRQLPSPCGQPAITAAPLSGSGTETLPAVPGSLRQGPRRADSDWPSARARGTQLEPGRSGAGAEVDWESPLRRRAAATGRAWAQPSTAQARCSKLGARPPWVSLLAGGGLRAHEQAGRDVCRATPYVTGPCVVAAGLPSAAASDDGGAAAGRGVRGSRGRRRRRGRPGGPAPHAAQSQRQPLLGPPAAPGLQLPPFLTSFPRALGSRRGALRRGAGRPRGTTHPPSHPGRAPCEGGTGLAPRPAPDSSRAPPAPGGPRPPRTGGRGDRPCGGGGAGSEATATATAAPSRACSSLPPRGAAGGGGAGRRGEGAAAGLCAALGAGTLRGASPAPGGRVPGPRPPVSKD
ncbi:Collagen Alpha-5(Vi) Chain [Manis pentadactyla]|nr:Collagen Alpha-5(Vi) Chain [Manis pentadactyla]